MASRQRWGTHLSRDCHKDHRLLQAGLFRELNAHRAEKMPAVKCEPWSPKAHILDKEAGSSGIASTNRLLHRGFRPQWRSRHSNLDIDMGSVKNNEKG
jgi:hypothetical protein